MHNTSWKPEETAIARRMFADDESPDAFLAKLGRSETAAREHVKRADVRVRTEVRAVTPKIPACVIADAVRRATAPRSLTADVCGDPAPGQSALDRRNRAEASL
jgi:hypothetical protein